MIGYQGIFTLLVSFIFAAFASAVTPNPDVEALQKRADAVIAVDKPAARNDVGEVFKAAEAFATAGKLDQADHYYAAGLGIDSHDFERHLAYAELLAREHKAVDQKIQVEIIAKGCEDPGLVVKAESLISILPPEITPFDKEKMSARAATIILVPLGDIDVFLLQKEALRLHDELGIDVQIHSLPVKIREPARNVLHDQAEALRGQLQQIQASSPKDYAKLLKQTGLSQDDLKDDSKVFRLISHLLKKSGETGKAKEIDQLLAQGGDQWSADDLLSDLTASVPAGTADRIRFIGITNKDIFGTGTNFLFGLAAGKCAVVSYRRFLASFNDEVPSRERLWRRFHYQCLSSSGRVFGVPPCTDPACPRCYPNDLAEQDAKTDKLCDVCRKGFDMALK